MSARHCFPPTGVWRTGDRGQVRKPQQRHRPSPLRPARISGNSSRPDPYYGEQYGPTPRSSSGLGLGSRGPIHTPYSEQYALTSSPSPRYCPEQNALTASPRSATRSGYLEQYALTPPFSPAVQSPESPYNHNYPTSHPCHLISPGDSRRSGMQFIAQDQQHGQYTLIYWNQQGHQSPQPSPYGQSYQYPQHEQRSPYAPGPQYSSRVSSQDPSNRVIPNTPPSAPPTPEPPEPGSPYTPMAPYERKVHFSEQCRRARVSPHAGGGDGFVVPRPATPHSPRTLRAAKTLLDISRGDGGAGPKK
jgi:hypothetical protein